MEECTFFARILSTLYCCCRVWRNEGFTGFQVNGNVLAEITLFVDAFVLGVVDTVAFFSDPEELT
jgi:hypothetical protein